MTPLTIAQMHQGVRLAVQQVDANYLDGLLPAEIDFYLNETITEWVKATFSGARPDGRGFEESQVRIDDLQDLLVTGAEAPATYVGSPLEGIHLDRAPLPDDYLFLISQRSAIEYDLSGATLWGSTPGQSRGVLEGSPSPSGDGPAEALVLNRLAQSDDVYRLLKDPYNTTYYKEPLTSISTQFVHVYTDNVFVTDRVILNYLRAPATVALVVGDPGASTDCDLPGHVHNEIVRSTAARITVHLRQLSGQAR